MTHDHATDGGGDVADQAYAAGFRDGKQSAAPAGGDVLARARLIAAWTQFAPRERPRVTHWEAFEAGWDAAIAAGVRSPVLAGDGVLAEVMEALCPFAEFAKQMVDYETRKNQLAISVELTVALEHDEGCFADEWPDNFRRAASILSRLQSTGQQAATPALVLDIRYAPHDGGPIPTQPEPASEGEGSLAARCERVKEALRGPRLTIQAEEEACNLIDAMQVDIAALARTTDASGAGVEARAKAHWETVQRLPPNNWPEEHIRSGHIIAERRAGYIAAMRAADSLPPTPAEGDQ